MTPSSNKGLHALAMVLFAMAVIYAFVAGLRTVADFDVGWMLATGRYIVQHHTFPATDALSYTARGNPFLYPVLSPVLLYGLFASGGFVALSFLNAIASAVAVAVTTWRKGLAAGFLALIAVPLIALRTAPRADLFTTVLFAVFLTILWRYHIEGTGALWLLPLLMVAWVNLHPGFIAGLALCIAYIGIELLFCLMQSRRADAIGRLRRFRVWLALTFLSTMASVWGWRVWQGVWQQEQQTATHTQIIGEWYGLRLNATSIAMGFRWRDPNSAIWWLLLAGIVAGGVALWRKDFGAAFLLGASAYAAIHHSRFQALFAIVVIVVGGYFLTSLGAPKEASRYSKIVAAGLVVMATALLSFRTSDLVSNYSYFQNADISRFGGGLASWYPERASAFLSGHHLPGNVFNTYSLGGYLALSLGPEYPVYIDGRAVPFGSTFLREYGVLLSQLPDSAAWTKEAERHSINTIIVSTSRYGGLGTFPLEHFCKAKNWKPVFLDDTAAIFVRNTPTNSELLSRLAIDCETVRFEPPPHADAAAMYDFLANEGAILYVLGLDAESGVALREAERIFPDDPNLHLTMAQLLQADGQLSAAEREYRRSIEIRPTSAAWYAFGQMLGLEHRTGEMTEALKKSQDLLASIPK